MTKKEKIEKFIEKYNGYLITSLVCSEDISKTYVAKYIKEHGMEKVSRGVYITDDVWPDELFVLQQRNEKGNKCYFGINTPKTKSGCRQIPMQDYVKDAFIVARQFATWDIGHATIPMPRFSIIYVKRTDRTPKKTTVTFTFPDGQTVHYESDNVILEEFTKEYIVEKRLLPTLQMEIRTKKGW